jgi:hypothetical protein
MRWDAILTVSGNRRSLLDSRRSPCVMTLLMYHFDNAIVRDICICSAAQHDSMFSPPEASG